MSMRSKIFGALIVFGAIVAIIALLASSKSSSGSSSPKQSLQSINNGPHQKISHSISLTPL